jgi:uncharacterized membrane protein
VNGASPTGPPATTRLDADTAFERALGVVLRTGVSVSAVVVAAGALVYLSRRGGLTPTYDVFTGEPADLRSVSGILGDARAGSGRGLIQLGLLLLIATPVARVVFSIVGFARQRDWLYVGMAALVLLLLTVSLLSG